MGGFDSLGLIPSAVLSGVFAGILAVLITLAIERLGGILGGILASIPSTTIPASVGFYLEFLAKVQPDPDTGLYDQADRNNVLMFQKALLALPAGMILNSTFIWLWKLLPPLYARHFPALADRLYVFLAVMTLTTLSIWAVLAVSLVLTLTALSSTSTEPLQVASLSPSEIVHATSLRSVFIIAMVALFLQFSLGFYNSWNLPPAPKGKNKVSRTQLAARGIVSGTAIFCSVLISRTSPFAAGVAAVFPAVVVTVMVSVWLSQGKAVTQGAIGPLILGSTSMPVNAIVLAFLCPWMVLKNNSSGIVAAAFIVAWVISLCATSVPLVFFLNWRRKVMSGKRERSISDKTLVNPEDPIVEEGEDKDLEEPHPVPKRYSQLLG